MHRIMNDLGLGHRVRFGLEIGFRSGRRRNKDGSGEGGDCSVRVSCWLSGWVLWVDDEERGSTMTCRRPGTMIGSFSRDDRIQGL